MRIPASPTPSFPIRYQIAEAIKKRLAAHDMSQRELAAMLGMTQARLNALMTEKLEQFSVDALIALAMMLELNVRVTVTRPYNKRDDRIAA